MAWAKTSLMGCGYALYKDGNFKSNEIVVCNYSPTGNYPGQSLYKKGKPCSKCEKGKKCSKKYPGLCI